MPRNFSAQYLTVTNGTDIALIALENPGTTVQPEIYEVMVGSGAAPLAYSAVYTVNRGTVDGTGGSTAQVGYPLNPDTPAALMTTRTGGTAGTLGVAGLTLPLNMQATYRWVVQPGQGLGVYGAHAAATDSLQFKSLLASTAFAVSGHVMWAE